MPYIMALHEKPTDKKRYGHYYSHVEFYPPYKNKDILKFPAGVERAIGTFTYDYEPESKAQELRTALARADRAE